jgi:hypothetical protein
LTVSILGLRGQSSGLRLSPRHRRPKAAAPPTIVQEGLLAEWRFDEGSGQVFADASGHGHHGQLGSTAGVDAADPTWTAAGLHCDLGDSAIVADGAGISGGAARSLVAVVKGDASGNLTLGWLGSGSTNFTRWQLFPSGGKLRIGILGAGYTSNLTMPAASWYFLAATQSTSNINSAKLYVNGASDGSTASGACATAGGLRFNDVGGQIYVQDIAYMLVYDRALADAEVATTRDVLRGKVAPRGIMLP